MDGFICLIHLRHSSFNIYDETKYIHAYLRDEFKVILAETTVFSAEKDVETIKRKIASR